MRKLRIVRNIQLGVKSLMLHLLRSVLTMLGMVFGVGSVIAMLSVGEGAGKVAQDQIRKLGARNIIIDTQKPEDDQGQSNNTTGRSLSTVFGLTYDDHERIKAVCNDVELAVPAKIINKQARVSERTADVRIVGTTPDWFKLVERELLAGRVLTQHDVDERASVCVLAEEAARTLLAGNYAIGKTVRIGEYYFRVVGVVKTEKGEGGGSQTPDRPLDAYIPLNVVQGRFGDMVVTRTSSSFSREITELHQIILRVDDTEHVVRTSLAVQRGLEQNHKKTDYKMSVPLALLRQAREQQRITDIVLGSIAGISLLVGGIGIMNIMLASVTERTREIGVRRAIGAKRRQIIGQFLIEAIVLTTAGGVIGVIVGVTIAWAVQNFADMPTIVTTSSVILALGISVLVGVIFGMYPAYRAAMLDPIEALRHE